MTNIEMNAMHAIVYLPKAIEQLEKQLKRIADVLEKMEAKDGPTIGQIVRDAIEKGKENQ
jgi:hypothetical protein